MNGLVDIINEYFEAHNFYERAYKVSDTVMQVEISWGDWKHDHLRCTYLVREAIADTDYRLTACDEDITESDGSDCYSAIHNYFFVKEA